MSRILFALLLVTLLTLTLSSPVWADIAPPQQPPGFNPEPGAEGTQVRMFDEIVTIEVLGVDPPQAHFIAIFTMRNLGSSTEEMAVRFPIAVNDGSFNISEVEDITIMVNDLPISYRRVEGAEPLYGFEDESVPWAEFSVNFPPGEDVKISVSYNLDGTSYDYETYTNFYYILATGAGWNGTIGSGEIILHLPYDASPQNVILDDPQNTGRSSWQGMPRFSGHEVHWTFTDLEPTSNDNIIFDIVKPMVWKTALIELENITKDPQDGEAWGFLGKAYKQALFASGKGYPRVDAGADELYQLSRDAYGQAIQLKPEDGLWHAGYAELLLDEYYWVNYQDRSYTSELDLGLREFDLAVRLAPDASKVQELVEEYTYMFPDYIVRQPNGSLDFVSLTATPQSPTEVVTPIPTRMSPSTPVPATSTSEDEKGGGAAPQLCGGVGLLLVALALIHLSRRLG
jgi:hypothetical protein